MIRIAVFNSKGGVGKTTTVLNLAAAAHRAGETPLLLDLDPQLHLTRIWGESVREAQQSLFAFFQEVQPLNALEREWPEIGSIVPAHGQLIKVDSIFGKGPTVLNKLKAGLDSYELQKGKRKTLIDCCPYMGVLSLNAIFSADLVLVPVSTDYLSLQAAHQITHALGALEPVLKRRVARRYVLTRFDRRRRMSFDVRDKIIAQYGDEVCQTVIGENVAIAESPAYSVDVFRHQAYSAGAADYRALYEELQGIESQLSAA